MCLLLAAIVFLAANLPAVSAVAQSAQVNPERVLAEIKAQAATIKTLVVQFKQERISRLLRKPLISEGLIYFERGGKMLTQINSPSALQLLMENDYVTVVNHDLGVVQKKRLSRSDQMIKTWLEWDVSIESIKTQYNLRLTTLLKLNRYKLQLAPKEEKIARRIAAIEIEINTDTLMPEQIMIQTTNGDRTSVQLHVVSINEPMPAGIFDIEIPELFQNDR